jgi:hypothetical protein
MSAVGERLEMTDMSNPLFRGDTSGKGSASMTDNCPVGDGMRPTLKERLSLSRMKSGGINTFEISTNDLPSFLRFLLTYIFGRYNFFIPTGLALLSILVYLTFVIGTLVDLNKMQQWYIDRGDEETAETFGKTVFFALLPNYVSFLLLLPLSPVFNLVP